MASSSSPDRHKRKSRLAFLGALAGGLAHEIKNPLSTMTVNLSMIQEDLANPETGREQRTLRRIQLLEREVRRLGDILNDFLRFARGLKLDLKAEAMGSIVEEVIDFMEPEMNSRGIRLRVQIDSGLPLVLIDRTHFQQALLNLLINAQQALEGTIGGEILVRVGSGRDESRPTVRLSVTDTGPGIQPEYLPRIFDVYFSTKKDGTGMGLPTTRRIIEEHDGMMEVESEPGKGTSFVVSLPAVEEGRREEALPDATQ